jgi:tetratricopeptide (TPR) repeat protein
MLRRCLAASIVAVLATVVSTAQTTPLPRIERLEAWLTAVERHEPGASDSSLILAAASSTADLQELWPTVRALIKLAESPRHTGRLSLSIGTVGRPKPFVYNAAEVSAIQLLIAGLQRRGGIDRLVKRGALLHADVAMLTPTLFEANGTSALGARMVVEMTDGEHQRTVKAAPHMDFARLLLDEVKPKPADDETVRLLYQATLAELHRTERIDMQHAERALQLFPKDADILFQIAGQHEAVASVRVQRALRFIPFPQRRALRIGNTSEELMLAQTYFERALRANPDHVEARLRLGRVLGLRGKHAAAAVELRRSITSTKDPVLLYYGSLFLGSEEEALREPVRARAAYTRAATLYPRAQSVRLALSRLASSTDDNGEARRTAQDALALPMDGDRYDPWWDYHLAFARHAGAMLADLYRRFEMPGPQ